MVSLFIEFIMLIKLTFMGFLFYCNNAHQVRSRKKIVQEAVVAEWLRRLTRNQIPSGSVGSSPTDCENHVTSFFLFSCKNSLNINYFNDVLLNSCKQF